MLAEADTIRQIESQDRRDQEVPGVYAIFYGNHCIYIGESSNVAERMANHDYREWLNIPDAKLLWFKSNDRKSVEKELIKTCRPLLNGQGGWLHLLAWNEAKGTPIDGVPRYFGAQDNV
jgi:hypothetical protein